MTTSKEELQSRKRHRGQSGCYCSLAHTARTDNQKAERLGF